MSAIFDALFGGLERLKGNRDIRREMRLALDALHECSHEHEDWLNRSHQIRVAANRLDKAIAKSPRVPTSTADELPPEHTDILWWFQGANHCGWKLGRLETGRGDINWPRPGRFASEEGYGFQWRLWARGGLPVGNGPTWWMYLPPSPVREASNDHR